MDADALLEGLNDEQRTAVTTPAAPLCILAGAGSGKTRVLTTRIAYRAATGALDPRRALVLTFTRSAAGELHGRLRRLGLRDRPTAGTFHAIAYAQLRRRFAERNAAAPALLDRKVAFVARHLPRGVGLQARDVTTEIEWAKARVIGPDAYADEATAARREPGGGAAAVADAYRSYEAAKRKANMVDFDDLLWLAIHAVENDAELAAAIRWQHQHLFVDEFQDVNPLQHRLLRAWLGQRSDLCVVGDPNQAIYAWNGADPTLLTDFATEHPDAEVVALPRNHRSTPQILTLANRVLDAGALPGVRLVATRSDGPDPTVVAASSSDDECVALAAALRRSNDHNVPWAHHAVLVRTNALAAAVGDHLRAAGIPVRLRTQAPLLELPAVKAAMATLSRRGYLAGLALLEADLEADEGGDDERMALAELVRLAGEYQAEDPTPTAPGFAGWLAATTADDASAESDAVAVATFHAAKGLEWPVVHLAGLEDGLAPHSRARTPESLAEERRLFYVGITRAERVLHLSWAATRAFGDKQARRRPSPFLAELRPVLDMMATAAAEVDGAEEVGEVLDIVRARRAAPRADDPLAAALRTWRDDRARANGMPAAQVLDDATITILCADRPADEAALALVVGPVRAPRLARELIPIIDSAPKPRALPSPGSQEG